MPKISEYLAVLKNKNMLHDGFLLSESERKSALTWFNNTDAIKCAKNEQGIPYSLIKDKKGHIFAIYNPGKEDVMHGAYGIIKIAQNIETGECCLVKIQKTNQGKHFSNRVQQMRQEKRFLKRNHLLHGYQERIDSNKNIFISYTFMTELPGSPIVDIRDPNQGFAKNRGRHLTELEGLIILKNCFERLAELQQVNIIHRDLSPQNVLIDDDLNVYFVDWGSAVEPQMTGFCEAFPPQLGFSSNKKVRYANGYDFLMLLDIFSELRLLDNLPMRTEILKIRHQCGDQKKGYNVISVLPLISKAKELIKSCPVQTLNKITPS